MYESKYPSDFGCSWIEFKKYLIKMRNIYSGKILEFEMWGIGGLRSMARIVRERMYPKYPNFQLVRIDEVEVRYYPIEG